MNGDTVPGWVWIAFNATVLLLLLLDLLVLNRGNEPLPLRKAIRNCIGWGALAFGFNAVVAWWRGPTIGAEFLTAYVVELSLSVDNVFVFLVLFQFFHVKPEHQHRILFWGILGAVLMRASFILGGMALIARFDWMIYLLGALLVGLGIKMVWPKGDDEPHPDRNPFLRLIGRFVPISSSDGEGRFFFREGGRRVASRLFAVLVAVETTDLVFALDSIPAVLAITRDPFTAYASNVLAVLGLRALYFTVAGVLGLFRFLKYGLALVLVFVGVKMLISHAVGAHMPALASLAVILGILGASVAASLLLPQAPPADRHAPPTQP